MLENEASTEKSPTQAGVWFFPLFWYCIQVFLCDEKYGLFFQKVKNPESGVIKFFFRKLRFLLKKEKLQLKTSTWVSSCYWAKMSEKVFLPENSDKFWAFILEFLSLSQ